MKRVYVFALSLLMSVFVLVGCSKAPSLEGTYTSKVILVETLYTFDKDFTVNASIFAGGFEIYDCNGTYTINEDETEITLKFESVEDSNSENVLNGTYTFSKGDGYIQIGKQKLNKMND